MKLLTLNTHSLIEPMYEAKLEKFCLGVGKMDPDVIALQEVNQTATAPVIKEEGNYPLRADNHVLHVVEMLGRKGHQYSFVWQGIKEGYGKFQEGLAILSKNKITNWELTPITPQRSDWKMRYILGVETDGIWYYSIHTGRWDDCEVSFSEQIRKICDITKNRHAIIMGDFNCPDKSKGFEILKNTGWQDLWGTSPVRCGCATAEENIDGWGNGNKLMRIDYIFSNFPVSVKECRVVFTPQDYGVVSDHRGVFSEIV